MNKKSFITLITIIAVLISCGIYFYISNNNNQADTQNEYEASKTSTNQKTTENSMSNNTLENSETGNPQYIEEQLSTFSTTIYSKDSARQNNIQITCNTLNDTIVKNENTFSFCDTVGQATSAKGYQQADIFDRNGNKKKGLRRWKLSSKQYFI